MDGEEPMPIIRQIAEAIVSLPADLRRGSLRIFGTWLGEPLNDEMTITDATVAGHRLELRFEGGEVLHIWEPRDFGVRPHIFRIAGASRVLYRWSASGEPKTPESLIVTDYTLEEGRVIRKSSAPRSPPIEDLGAATDTTAVELVRPDAALTGLPGRRESADRRRGEVAHIVAQIDATLEGRKAGSLRIFGDGFARPLDHARKISGAFTGDGYLVLTFAFGESLTIWDPAGYEGGTEPLSHRASVEGLLGMVLLRRTRGGRQSLLPGVRPGGGPHCDPVELHALGRGQGAAGRGAGRRAIVHLARANSRPSKQ